MHRGLYGLDWRLVLSCIMILSWSIVWLLYFAALIYGKLHLHKKTAVDDTEVSACLPGVSIAKPLCFTSDTNLKENLITYFELDYPKFELLFCIQDRKDEELIQLVTDLKTKHPSVDAQIFIGAKDAVVNPKINNMLSAYENAQYPLFMISDAGIKMKPDTITDMVNHMTEKVGIVHQMPIFCDGDLCFSRQVEQLWFGGAHARVYMASNAFGMNCMSSMSCMFRKKILDEEGGLLELGQYLGEDYFLAQLIINKGWRLVLSSQPALQNPRTATIQTYQNRMLRWMYLRSTQMPILLLLEPIQEHIVLAPLTAIALYYIFNLLPYIFIPIHFIAWIVADYILLTVIQNRRPAFSICSYVKAWVFRELSPLYLMPKLWRTRSIMWAGKRFKVHYGGVAERVIDIPYWIV